MTAKDFRVLEMEEFLTGLDFIVRFISDERNMQKLQSVGNLVAMDQRVDCRILMET